MIRKILKAFLISALISVIFFVAFAFANYSINPSKWAAIDRAFLAFFFIASTAVTAIITFKKEIES